MSCTVLLYTSTLAQNWCAPGAGWRHTYTGCFGCADTGFVRTVYAGDSIVLGSNCQVLEVTKHAWSIGTGIYSEQQLPPLITRGQQDLVEKWNGTAFDTLFHFAAVPSDSWDMIGLGWGIVSVLDTGHALVNGASLRYLIVDLGAGSTGPQQDTIYARMGFKSYYMDGYSPFYFDSGLEGLRCYSDNNLDYSSGIGPVCDFTLASAQLRIPDHCGAFPNPSTGQFTLSYPAQSEVGVLEVRDRAGRIIRSERIQQWSTVHRVALDNIPDGLYMCRLQWQGQTASVRVIVEH